MEMSDHIYANNLYDINSIERCTGFDELRTTVSHITPQQAAAYCGVPATEICTLAEHLSKAKTVACYGLKIKPMINRSTVSLGKR